MKIVNRHFSLDKACQLLGSQARMAELLGVKPPTVNQWVHLVKKIPAERCVLIEKLTHGKVKCEDLRSDVDWSYLRGAAPIDQNESAHENA